MVGLLTFLLGNLKDASTAQTAEAQAAAAARLTEPGGILNSAHMANLGRHLFAEHLISVELAGTLLLAALVGAVAIAIQGRPRQHSSQQAGQQARLAARIEEALR
jgi:NADH:ubiquinone oxidoreductase subunit 6 (subunit J)